MHCTTTCHAHPGFDLGSISQSNPSFKRENDIHALLLTRTVVTARCMDPNLDRRHDHLGRLRYQQSNPNLHHASRRNPDAQLPGIASQRQWEDIPLPYRPREWRHPSEDASHQTVPEPLFAWRLRPGTNEPLQRNDAIRQRRRPHVLRNLFSRRELEEQGGGVNPSLLYPQMSPYQDQTSSLSAPDELEHFPRSVSQPNTPSFWPSSQGDNIVEPPLGMIPRSPTYPPASRRRPRSTANVADATFTDEEDFSLFVQATAGIMPEQIDRRPDAALMSRGHGPISPEEMGNLQSPGSEHIVSPLQETPTTMRALQQLAQLPHGSLASRQRDIQDPQISTLMQRADEAAMAGVDLWLEPPTPAYDENEVSPIDDELPDYASSQEQAHAAQRVEAARRAQELQNRWRQSQGNY